MHADNPSTNRRAWPRSLRLGTRCPCANEERCLGTGSESMCGSQRARPGASRVREAVRSRPTTATEPRARCDGARGASVWHGTGLYVCDARPPSCHSPGYAERPSVCCARVCVVRAGVRVRGVRAVVLCPPRSARRLGVSFPCMRSATKFVLAVWPVAPRSWKIPRHSVSCELEEAQKCVIAYVSCVGGSSDADLIAALS